MKNKKLVRLNNDGISRLFGEALFLVIALATP
jgi:hypothetical protein